MLDLHIALPRVVASTLAVVIAASAAAQGAPAGIDWQPIGSPARFSIARTETTIGQFRRFAEATQTRTRAEREGGGEVYESGWTRKPGWTWRTPFGASHAPADDEPAVHLSFDEAQAFCRWAGGRLPTDPEWLSAAYTEQRSSPAAGFERGRTYPWPTGASAAAAQCLDDCGPAAKARAVKHGARLWRGDGHAPVNQTPAGVNGLDDMRDAARRSPEDQFGQFTGVDRAGVPSHALHGLVEQAAGGDDLVQRPEGGVGHAAQHVQQPGFPGACLGDRCARPCSSKEATV